MPDLLFTTASVAWVVACVVVIAAGMRVHDRRRRAPQRGRGRMGRVWIVVLAVTALLVALLVLTRTGAAAAERPPKAWVLVVIEGDEEGGYYVWPGASDVINMPQSYTREADCATARAAYRLWERQGRARFVAPGDPPAAPSPVATCLAVR